MTIQITAGGGGQYFPVVPFTMVMKVPTNLSMWVIVKV